MHSLILLVVLLMPAADPTITAEQFARLMHAQHSRVKDVAYVYEGTNVFGPRARNVDGSEKAKTNFQGTYILRSDGAEYLDLYKKSDTPTGLVRRDTSASAGGFVEKVTQVPDLNRRPVLKKSSGGTGSLKSPDSPHCFHYSQFFLTLSDPAGWGYVFQGWEQVGEHRCLRVRLNQAEVPDTNFSLYKIFWIDMARGGHPLKVEDYTDGEMVGRLDDVELRAFPLVSGAEVYLPVKGTNGGHEWYRNVPGQAQTRREISAEPFVRREVGVVLNSVQLDQGLPDTVFDLKAQRSGLPEVGNLRALQRIATGRGLYPVAATQRVERARTDPKGVQERLDKMLVEADKQAVELQASSPSQLGWSWAMIAQAIAGVSGLGLIAFAVYWKWSGR